MKQSKIQNLLIEFVKKVDKLSPNNPIGNIVNLNLISHDYSCKFKAILDDLQKTTKAQTTKQILNLECLKEWEVGEKGGNRDEVGIANFVIKQIKEEIKKL